MGGGGLDTWRSVVRYCLACRLNFLSTFRECRASKAPGCGPGEEWVTMPQFFRQQGYFTSSAGKIFHDGMDDPPSWSY